MDSKNVTCSFVTDRDEYDIPNADTFLAIDEVQVLKKDSNKKVYHSFGEVLEELDADE